jgi:peptide-methionine (R)-S-oxide reductase
VNRRNLLATALFAAPFLAKASAEPAVSVTEFSTAGQNLGKQTLAKVVHSDGEWRAMLSPLAYQVTRHDGTEQAFTGPGWNNHGDGLYRCVCCDTALFDSKTKYESGTGWPSFYRPIAAGNVVERRDTSLFMERIAVSCVRCDAHLGHVFDDGPRPTGLRYCMNAVALKFVART